VFWNMNAHSSKKEIEWKEEEEGTGKRFRGDF
jgi:hypothetical protein